MDEGESYEGRAYEIAFSDERTGFVCRQVVDTWCCCLLPGALSSQMRRRTMQPVGVRAQQPGPVVTSSLDFWILFRQFLGPNQTSYQCDVTLTYRGGCWSKGQKLC